MSIVLAGNLAWAGDIQVPAMTSGVKTGSEGEPELLPETLTWIAGNAQTRKVFWQWTPDVTSLCDTESKTTP